MLIELCSVELVLALLSTKFGVGGMVGRDRFCGSSFGLDKLAARVLWWIRRLGFSRLLKIFEYIDDLLKIL